MAWDDAAAAMDEAVDDLLGDRILYAANGVTFVEIPGFVLLEADAPTLDSVDEIMGSRPRIKIAKAQVPDPDMGHRLRHPKLGAATFRPAGALPQNQGRYWVFDVEKV